jgi:hypothetical protein
VEAEWWRSFYKKGLTTVSELSIDTYEPFTSVEVRNILRLSQSDYARAVRVGTLKSSGSIRVMLPCKERYHNFWDILEYCIFMQFSPRHLSAPQIFERAKTILDNIVADADHTSLTYKLVLSCTENLTQALRADRTYFGAGGVAFIHNELVRRAICMAYLGLSNALQDVFGDDLATVKVLVRT